MTDALDDEIDKGLMWRTIMGHAKMYAEQEPQEKHE